MRTDDLYLAGIGSVLPERVTTADAVARGWYDADQREASGIASVTVSESTPAPELAITAARTALARADVPVEDFGMLLHSYTHHQGPDGWSSAHYVLHNTLDRPVPAIEVRQGCLGMLAATEVAACRLVADPARSAALITTGDNFSTPLVDRWRSSRLFVFADAGCSVVLRRGGGGFARLLAIGSLSDSRMEAMHRGGEQLFPPGVTVGRSLNFDERAEYMRTQWAQGQAPPMGHFGEKVSEIVEVVLKDAGLTMADITRVAHVGFNQGPLEAMFLDPLDVDPARGTWEFTRTVGHTGAADLFLGLEQLWTSGQVTPGDRVLLVGAATGMEAGCAVVEIQDPYRPERES